MIAVMLSVEKHSDGDLTFKATPVTVTDDKIRNLSDFNAFELGKIYWDDLTAMCYGKADSMGTPQYGYDHPYLVTTETVGKLAKSITLIDKRMAKLAALTGRPDSFGAYVTHFASAIGAERIYWPTTSHGWSYDQNEHAFTELANGPKYVNRWVQEKQA